MGNIPEISKIDISYILKNRRLPLRVSPKKIAYDFLRRHYPHQVKGSKLITSSQPASQAPPCLIICYILSHFVKKYKQLFYSSTSHFTLIFVPFPASLSKASSPSVRLQICFTMASPSPVPPSSLERLLSTR